jgi:hypothetical protein
MAFPMRRPLVLIVAAVVGLAAAGGCTPHRTHAEVSGVAASAAQHRAPAPANPDLGTVMERFYEQIEGAHWPFAYAMLSQRYRASLSQDAFVARYDGFADMDVALRQRGGDRIVVATIAAKERGAAGRARRFEETATLGWDGDDWRIDRIARRDLTPAGTR